MDAPPDPLNEGPSKGAPRAGTSPPAVLFAGDAAPFTGGDPWADYRTTVFPFGHLTDLADHRLGGSVVAANDEFFADRENLLKPGAAEFDPGGFGNKGKTMDGWETRRRRGTSAARPHPAEDDHDWALVRLGAPGVVRGIVVDTAHFRGNYPQAVSVEGTALTGTPSPEALLGDLVKWTTLVPRTLIGGHAANGFTVEAEQRFTHLRVIQHPDGGIARLRVHGEVVPDPAWLAALVTFDLVALENGGRVEDASDRFYSPAVHTILPGRSRRMDEGWETRRRRDLGNDWIRYRLVERSGIRAAEIDTARLRGNSAGWAALSARDGTTGDWTEILPRTALRPDTNHRFILGGPVVATDVRLDIFPDGGISRLRLFGSLTASGAGRLAARYQELGG